jgi:hypothetical protein
MESAENFSLIVVELCVNRSFRKLIVRYVGQKFADREGEGFTERSFFVQKILKAIRCGDLERLSALLSQPHDHSITELQLYAIERQQSECLKRLLQEGPAPELALLYAAISHRNSDAVRILLAHGINPNVRGDVYFAFSLIGRRSAPRSRTGHRTLCSC